MKKLIFILLFSIIATASFAQASAASARMFKDTKAWQQREFLRLNRGYTLDTAELYGLIGLSKDFAGHTNWQYSTSNIANTFASLFPILGRTNSNAMISSYFRYQTNARYSGHNLTFFGSPTLTNNSFVFNGTTQYATLIYFRDWSASTQNMTPRFLMDSILAISPTDTLAQTNMNMSIYMKDSLDRFLLGTNAGAAPVLDWRLFSVSNTTFTYRSFIETNSSTATITKSSSGNYYASNRSGLTKEVAYNGNMTTLTPDGSYNFNVPRSITNNLELMGGTRSAFQAGTVQYFDITRRALTATEMTNKYNAVREFIRRKTQ